MWQVACRLLAGHLWPRASPAQLSGGSVGRPGTRQLPEAGPGKALPQDAAQGPRGSLSSSATAIRPPALVYFFSNMNTTEMPGLPCVCAF